MRLKPLFASYVMPLSHRDTASHMVRRTGLTPQRRVCEASRRLSDFERRICAIVCEADWQCIRVAYSVCGSARCSDRWSIFNLSSYSLLNSIATEDREIIKLELF